MTPPSIYMDARHLLLGAADYPSALAAVPAPPPELWLRGRVPGGPAVAIVGARAASADGVEVARTVAGALARRGVCVVSGGAVGIDAAAHEGALAAGGATVVVLGTGIDVVYPQHHAGLFDRAVANGGAVLSQFPIGSGPTRWSFPTRNRVIAALAEAVVVVEAAASSGALHTAVAARALGRRLIARVGTAGCDRLAATGALVARTADEVLARLDGATELAKEPGPATPPAPAEPRARILYEALDGTPRDLGELAARAGLPADEAMALAIDLELGGFAARAAGGRYLRLSW